VIGRPGSLLWLAGFEAKLLRRDMSRLRPMVGWMLLGLFAAMHVIGVMTLRWFAKLTLPESFYALVATLGLFFIFGLMTAKSLTTAVQAIHGRRDLDLLLGAPISSRKVLGVRMGATAFGVALPFLYLVGPFLNAMALLGQPRWLAAYLVVIAAALIATVIGLLLALALMKTVGARRTETTAQIIAAVFGACFFLTTQARTLLPKDMIDDFMIKLGAVADAVEYGHADPIWLWAGKAAAGDVAKLVIVACFGLGVFVTAIWATAPSVAAWARASFGAPSKIGGAGRARVMRFGAGPRRALFVKEARLLLRNPLSLFHTLMKLLYLTPLAVVALRAQDQSVGVAALAGLIVAISLQLCSALASNTMRGEDASDLLAGAPMSMAQIRAVKLSAALGPVLVLTGAACLSIASVAPRAALAAFLLSCLSAAVAGQLALWNEEPPRRADLRRKTTDLSALALVETALTICFGGVAYWAIRGNLWAFAPALAIGALVWAMAPKQRPAPRQAAAKTKVVTA
jgi:ABC-2 type transport system permease protein